MDLLGFALAVLAVLATPGPTNTLLTTSGAEVGVRRSLRLVIAETAGYVGSVNLITLSTEVLSQDRPVLRFLLRSACAFYLCCSAIRLWREASRKVARATVSFTRVFVTTLSNPKSMVFAFMI